MTGILRVGLTGSIGMGKSTTAKMFAALGVPVHDADAVVHALYREKETVDKITALFGDVTDGKGAIDRRLLGEKVIGKPDAMAALEALVHPLVHQREADAVTSAAQAGHPYVVLDIPLLFETGGDKRCDRIVVVTAPPEVQRERVLARDSMTVERFEAILAKQTPDSEKRRRADFVIDTSLGLEAARQSVAAVHEALVQEAEQAGREKP